jgi:predicted branched-subunit amino acid permease
VAGAIAVFGVVFGAAAQPVLGTFLTLAASVFVFSGAAQFTMVGLLAGGASASAVLIAVAVLNLRHLALGALLRPRLAERSAPRRAGLAWFLIDETAGLSLVARKDPGRTLLRVGAACYVAWVAGTAVGLAGAAVPGLEDMAAAVFPVLFVGLAAMTAAGLTGAARAVIAAALTVGLLAFWPGLAGLAPLVAAAVIALPGRNK